MASQDSSNPNPKQSLYPQINESHPESSSPFLSTHSAPAPSLYPSVYNPNPKPNLSSSSSSLYPSIDMKDLAENLFPDTDDDSAASPAASAPPLEETLIVISAAILHLIDNTNSLELAAGDFSIARIRQADNIVAVLARIGDVQWPLARDSASVKLDDLHYFFSLRDPSDGESDEGVLSYGLTVAPKGQEKLLEELDRILESCSSFSKQKVEGKKGEVLDATVEKELTPAEAAGPKKELMEERAAAYWTTLAPNVEDYGGSLAKGIAIGSGRVIQGILWCGEVTVDRLKWGEEFLKRRMEPGEKPSEVSKDALKRMKRFDFDMTFLVV